ncbi:MAG TPA: hypothetical protein VFB76_10620 [Candidatus Angelobacter sp.]|nr:hypothetical protein [Candidatus Angelobacter sp.]
MVVAEIPAAKWGQYSLTEKNRPQKQFTPSRDFWGILIKENGLGRKILQNVLLDLWPANRAQFSTKNRFLHS